MIDWGAFLIVAVTSLVAATAVVSLYSFGLRLLTTAGRVPVVTPAEFTDAITVITPEEAERAAKRAAKAARKNPLTDSQKLLARYGAYACFVLCGAAVLFGIYLIVPLFHR
ncbi:peptidase [Plantibacter sp. Mn2098]|uniref:peptidase n=1 Tax=Plantibacter sp. Mn2098 TaxID=3395266 RepID=UPI003BBB97A2